MKIAEYNEMMAYLTRPEPEVLPQPKPQELLDIQEKNKIERQQDTMNKARPFLMDESVDFIERENFKRGNVSNHPVKPLTKDQQKIYNMMLNKELPTNRPSVANRLLERFNKPWEQLDNTARANFINQTYPRYKKLLERSEGKISRNQLAKILSEKLGRPISLGQIHGYGTNRLGQRQKTAFGRKLDEILNVTNVTPKNPMYKIPTDADIKKLKPLLDITPANSLKNNTVDNIVKLNKKYAGMYKSGKLPSLETVLKDFPNMTSTQASNATIRLSQIYSGNKFKLNTNIDPKIKKAVENIKVNKRLGDKIFKLIGDTKFNEYRNSMYRISLGIIDEKLGNSKGTFQKLKNQASQILKDNKIPVYSPEKKNAAGKIIQKAKQGFNINEIAGVSGSAKSKAAEFSQFIDVMEGNLNQKTMANFQSKLSSAREMIENNPEMLSTKSKEINKLAKNLENTYGVELPRLRDPDATKYFSPKRLKELQAQGLDIVKAAERAGYTVQMPKGAQTIQEFIEKPKMKKVSLNDSKNIAKQLASFGFKCSASEGGACDNPMNYLDDIKKQQALAKGSGNAAANAVKKLSAGKAIFREVLGPAALGFELAAAVPITYLGYKAGLPPARIIADATYGLFGDTEKARLKKIAVDEGIDTAGLDKVFEFQDKSKAMQTLAQQEGEFKGPDDEMQFAQQYEKGEEDFYKSIGQFTDEEGDVSKKVYNNLSEQLKRVQDIVIAQDTARAAERSSRVADFGGIADYINYNSGGRVNYSNGSDGTALAIEESLEAFQRYLKAGGKLSYKDFIAVGGEGVSKFFNSGGRVGFADGPDNPKRRTFMKVMAGIASLPILGKFFKGAKTAKVVKLANTTTNMPDWFPAFVDNAFAKGIGKKIDADLTELEVPELPGVKVLAHDDGRIRVEGKNAYDETYEIEYTPPGYEVVDETTGKTVKTSGEFQAMDTQFRRTGSPDEMDYDVDYEVVKDVDDILGGNATQLEGFAKGTNKTKETRGSNLVDKAEADLERADVYDPYGDVDPTDFTDD